MEFPQKVDVLKIQQELIDQFGGIHGMRDAGLLDSALMAAANRHHYEGADLATCAATYAFHLTKAHAFLDGNKRIAASVALTFLDINSATIEASDEELLAFFLAIADGTLTREAVERQYALWVRPKP